MRTSNNAVRKSPQVMRHKASTFTQEKHSKYSPLPSAFHVAAASQAPAYGASLMLSSEAGALPLMGECWGSGSGCTRAAPAGAGCGTAGQGRGSVEHSDPPGAVLTLRHSLCRQGRRARPKRLLAGRAGGGGPPAAGPARALGAAGVVRAGAGGWADVRAPCGFPAGCCRVRRRRIQARPSDMGHLSCCRA
jgi:hypothetical protein